MDTTLCALFIASRTAVGVSTLLCPTLATDFLGVDLNPGSRILCRLFGARELALAAALWWTSRRALSRPSKPDVKEDQADAARRRDDLRLVLLVGIAVDAVDTISSAVSIAEGNLYGRAIWLVGAGAFVFASTGAAIAQLSKPKLVL